MATGGMTTAGTVSGTVTVLVSTMTAGAGASMAADVTTGGAKVTSGTGSLTATAGRTVSRAGAVPSGLGFRFLGDSAGWSATAAGFVTITGCCTTAVSFSSAIVSRISAAARCGTPSKPLTTFGFSMRSTFCGRTGGVFALAAGSSTMASSGTTSRSARPSLRSRWGGSAFAAVTLNCLCGTRAPLECSICARGGPP
jgi:hypothetical protein